MSILPFLWIWLVHKTPEGREIPVDFREPAVTSLSGLSWQRSDITSAQMAGEKALGNEWGFFSHPCWTLLLTAQANVWPPHDRADHFHRLLRKRQRENTPKSASRLYRWLHIMQHCIRTPSKSHSADNAEKMGFWTAKNKQGSLWVGCGNWVNPALKNGDCLKCDYCY